MAKFCRHHELASPQTDLFLPGRRLGRDIVRRLAGPCDGVSPANELFVEALAVDRTTPEETAINVALADQLAGRRPLIYQDLELAHRGRPALPDFAAESAILLAHHRVDTEEHDTLTVDLDDRGIDRLAGPLISFASTAVANIAIITERNSLIINSFPGEAPIERSA